MKFIVYASILSLGLLKFANAACAGPYAQCGGNNFQGEKCCESGYKCVTLNEWYSQCQPDASAVSNATANNNNNNGNQWNNNNGNQWNNNWNQWNQQPQQQNQQPQQQNQQPQQQNQQPQQQNQQPQQQDQQPQQQNQQPQQQDQQPQQQNQQPQQQDQQPQQQEQQPAQQTQPTEPAQPTQPTEPTQPTQPTQPEPQAPAAGGGSGSSQNFFVNEIYANPKFIEEVESSIAKLDPELKAKAEKVKQVPTAVWLAWDGAPGEVGQHLQAAGTKTVVFIMYMIPTRDCNANASAGGASDLNKYKGYVDSIASTIKKSPSSKVVMVLEPDTLGNLVTGTSDACKNVHQLHKDALSYAVNVFGSLSNVSVYLDAAHGKWLGPHTDKVASVVKEILSKAPNGKIRGLSTNVSNYQPISSEYQYHQKLASSLEAAGIPGMKFIVDTGRNGVDTTEIFAKQETWCNLIGTGFGEHPKGNPNPSMPLLDAYMWLKTPGEADGSAQGARADPVCTHSDSLQGAPDAGSWFHEYFVQLLKNAKPAF